MKVKVVLTLLLMAYCGVSYAQDTPQPINIGVSEVFQSAILKESKNINIYLPPNYQPNDTVSYPVVYVLDGGVEADFIHVVGLVRFNTQPWIDRFPNSIVVGIENVDRRRDFTFDVPNIDFLDKLKYDRKYFPAYGKSESYISFLEKELIPFIQHKYKGTGARTVVGESLAGLLEVDILLHHPTLFSNYVIISPSLWWGDTKFLNDANRALMQNINQNIRVYIGVPSKQEDEMMYNDAKVLYDNLILNKNLKVYWDYLPDELHSTIMHQAVNNALRAMYTKTAFSVQ